MKAIGFALGAALAASLMVLLIGVLVLGTEFGQWSEPEGRVVGVAGTIAGVAGAVGGLRIARSQDRP